MKKGIDYIGAGCGCLIVNDDNQILLLSHNKFDGAWSQPGGSIEFGEDIESAIKREIKEELGVEIELFGPKTYAETIETKKGKKRHWLVGGRFAKIISGEPKNMEPEKHAEIKRFDLDDLPENITAFTKPYIEGYKKRKKGK
ncbi:MAG TPA: NUDIX domain-containing protein [Candidatus Absconditabacterales bacterium]|nr:NUDIX domain-containing protein [Candidatus Absconditabacterales bacterium]